MRIALRGLAYSYIAYLVVTFLVLLPALNFLPPWLAKEHWGRTLTTELVLFNPFTLALEARGGALSEPDGSEFLDFERVEANLSLASLIQSGVVFDRVTLKALNVHLQRFADGSLNISDLLPAPSTAAAQPATEAGELPALHISALDLSAGRITITDHQHPGSFSTHLEALELAVTGLSTVAAAGQAYRLAVQSEGGGRLLVQGELSLAAGSSSGSLTVDSVDLRPFWRFAEPWLAFELDSSHVNLSLQYAANWQDGPDFTVNDGKLELIGTRIGPRVGSDLQDTGMAIDALVVARR